MHSLHSVVGHVPQPITHRGILIANCEIYNYRQLASSYHIAAKNDADLLCRFLDSIPSPNPLPRRLLELDGVYAFAYVRNHALTLARDLLGEKPIWYSYSPPTPTSLHSSSSSNQESALSSHILSDHSLSNGTNNHDPLNTSSATNASAHFAFASEKKMLLALGFPYPQELNPRHILTYDLASHRLSSTLRPFFTLPKPSKSSYETIKAKTTSLLNEAIKKRVPSQKFGLLFSGGLDSVYLAYHLQSLGHRFNCYVTAIRVNNPAKPPTDLQQAIAAARQLGLSLKITHLNLIQFERLLAKAVNLIEDTNATKAAVAVAIYASSLKASRDGCRVIFSGLGAEELFAGYDRHRSSNNLNGECLSGLRKLYERDLYRDDVLTINSGVELRLPYLDTNLIKYALKIPQQYKIKEGVGKYILRDISEQRGLPHSICWSKKVAAQYGSKTDYALEKVAKLRGTKTKSAYLATIRSAPNLRLGVLFSGGKDSTYAAYLMHRQNYRLSCLITIKPQNLYSYMFQSSGVELTSLQACALALPQVLYPTAGEKELELKDLKSALRLAKDRYFLDGIITGALASTYQRDRIDIICDSLGLKVFSPLWHKDPAQEIREILDQGFSFMLTSIAADGLTTSLLGRPFGLTDLQHLLYLHSKNGLNVNGEGGEFETSVLDCPLFTKRIIVDSYHLDQDGSCTARISVTKAHLQEK